MGLLMPNLPTSQAMTELALQTVVHFVLWCFCNFTNNLVLCEKIEKIVYSILRQCFPQLQLSD